MEKDLHKRIEEAAENYIESNYKDSITPDWNKKDFLAGAEYGYKEAIKVAKKWLSEQTSWDYYDDRPCKLMTDDRLADFETDMNKLWEQ